MTADTLSLLALLLQFAATFYMVGLVWFVQRVHYPLFAGIGSQEFPAYEREHVSRTTPVVGPAMLIEAVTALALVVQPIEEVPPPLPWLGVARLAVIWLSTWRLQVPRHRDLSARFETGRHGSLVATNWIRTFAWSLRGLLLLWMASCAWAGAST